MQWVEERLGVVSQGGEECPAKPGKPLVETERRGATEMCEVARADVLEDLIGTIEDCPLRPSISDLQPDDLRRGRTPTFDDIRLWREPPEEPLFELSRGLLKLSRR